ncbi:MAG: Asp23/Gls24 family envelope stress response protein, partial [Acetobacteraceae bacterium]|nr:Asp23/Gls24 family envelope stress response protein [Acetobacteraceae bacterium]
MEEARQEPARAEDLDFSNVKIADEVVGVIAGIAASEVDGVVSTTGGLVGGISEMLGKRSPARGVRVEVGARQTAIDLHITVEYGARIPEVAQRVQE